MSLRFAIKTCPPDLKWAPRWGDTHFAAGLLAALERRGHAGRIDVKKTWYQRHWRKDQVVIHLRGNDPYVPRRGSFNVLWAISHLERLTSQELSQYDLIFVASNRGAGKLAAMTDRPVLYLPQCTDPERFFPDPSPEHQVDLLFLGNTRHIFRPIIKDLLPTPYQLHIYGYEWEKHIDPKYIKGGYFPNEQARKLYSSCKVLLNDHLDGMREFGILNNRIYDGLACAAFIISDEIRDEPDELGSFFVRYDGREDLRQKVDYYINHPAEGKKMAENGRAAVLAGHTFGHRAEVLLGELATRIQSRGDAMGKS